MLIQLSIHRYWTWHGRVHARMFYVLNFFFPFGLKSNFWLSPISVLNTSQKKWMNWMVPPLVFISCWWSDISQLVIDKDVVGSMMIHHICNGISTEWNRAELVCHIWSLIMFYWWEYISTSLVAVVFVLDGTWIHRGVAIKQIVASF